MTRVIAVVLVLTAASTLVGCNRPAMVSEPVRVSGRVTLKTGQPLRDVVLSLQPAAPGLQVAGMPVRSDGTFNGVAVPGKYVWVIAEHGNAHRDKRYRDAYAAVPSKYKEPHGDRTIVVGTDPILLKVEDLR